MLNETIAIRHAFASDLTTTAVAVSGDPTVNSGFDRADHSAAMANALRGWPRPLVNSADLRGSFAAAPLPQNFHVGSARPAARRVANDQAATAYGDVGTRTCRPMVPGRRRENHQ
jgi:hypothetical protein